MLKSLHEAKTRIPEEFRYRTYFSIYDGWLYHFVSDDRLCERCAEFAVEQLFAGNDIRFRFPYLEVIDTEEIEVNVHPHCRCYLTRMVNVNDPRWTE